SLRMATLSADDKATAINLMPSIENVALVKLSVNSSSSVNVTLNFTTIPDFAGKSMILRDSYLNHETIIHTDNHTYNFDIDKGIAATYGDERLSLVFVPSAVLPVIFSDVTVELKNQGAELKWSVASEQTNSRYEIHRSKDGVIFETVAVVKGSAGQAGLNTYVYLDQHPFDGTNYYRVKEIDADGKYVYSQIVSLDFSALAEENLVVYPNPADKFVSIKGYFQENTTVTIIDVSGKIVKYINFSPYDSLGIDVSDLKSGVYIIEVRKVDNKLIKSSKFIKK
ncbi:T9SS C-terminal target domain-containing protein, partial [Pseudoxanthomonas sp. SGD-10]